MRRQFRSEDVIRDGKPPECPECPKYKTCRKPCEAVERWISQDYIGRRKLEKYDSQSHMRDARGMTKCYRPDYNEFIEHMAYHYGIQDEPDTEAINNAWEILESLNVSRISMEFAELYYHQGKSLTETAKALKLSAQAVDSRRKILKKEIKDRMERKRFWEKIEPYVKQDPCTYDHLIVCFYYKDLMTVREIAEAIGVVYSTVRVRLKRFNSKIS